MNNASFLPEDYLAQTAERRTNIISLTLFGVVMIAVVGAFFVTNRQVRLVKQLQESINVQYQEAGKQIEQLKQLEKQEQEMFNKAELAAALVERVPRSILLAELVNRMPERLGLLEFDMKSERMKAAPPKMEDIKKGSLAKGKAPAKSEPQKVEVPRQKVTITMLGVAPTDLELSQYMTQLNTYPLIRDVTLDYSEQKEVEGRMMRQFKISMSLDPNADVRGIQPLTVPRVKNPMTDDVNLNTPTAMAPDAPVPMAAAASATNPGVKGD